MCEVVRLKLDLEEHRAKLFTKFLSTLQGINEGLTSGAPIQRLELILIDGNLLQLTDRKDDPRGEIREQQTSGLQNGVVRVAHSDAGSPEHVQNARDKLVRAISFTAGFVPGSIANDTMPLRQRGQAIEPGGP